MKNPLINIFIHLIQIPNNIGISFIIFIFFTLHSSNTIVAQNNNNIHVSEFKPSTTNYANLDGYIEYDYNGEKCALIIVDTNNPNILNFDGGLLGIIKTISKPGQVWVYVPNGLKRLTISAEGLGTLRDYDLGMSVQAARTYILTLTMKDVETIVFDDSIQSDITIRVIAEDTGLPLPNARISINGVSEDLNHDGILKKTLTGATYRYHIHADFYKSMSGSFTVDGKTNLFEFRLQPYYKVVTIKAPKGSNIVIDGMSKNTNEWSGRLTIGTHSLLCTLDKHHDYKKNIIVDNSSSRIITLEDSLQAILGHLSITSLPAFADVYIDNKKVGTTPFSTSCIIGEHSVEIKLNNHITEKRIVDITKDSHVKIFADLKKSVKVLFQTYPETHSIILTRKLFLPLRKRYLGTTPFEATLQPGKYKLRITAPHSGYDPLNTTILVSNKYNHFNFGLEKSKHKPYELFIGVGYHHSSSHSLYTTLGGYLYNFNIELGYQLGLSELGLVYWYDNKNLIPPQIASYKHMTYLANVGYGFQLFNRFRITPQTGITHIVLQETQKNFTLANGAYCTNISAGLKIDYALTQYLNLSLLPNHSVYTFNKSKGYSLLENLVPNILAINDSFGISCSLCIGL